MTADAKGAPMTQRQQLLRQGFEHLAHGNTEAAGACCQQVLQLQPDLVPAHFLVGLVALEAGERATAFSAFQSVVKLDPDHAGAWAQLAKLYMSEGQVNRADQALRETLRIRPEDPTVLDLIGTTLSLMGEHGAAQSFYRQATALRPGFVPFMQNLANNLVYHGDTSGAEQVFRDIISLQPDSPQAHWALATATRAVDASHLETMAALSEKHTDNPRARAFYLYAMGKEYEDLQQWEQAFNAFSSGAAARRSTVDYDEQAEIAMFDYLEQHYTRAWLDQPGAGNPDASPIFVIGQPRTGTTLIERIITSHSQVHSAGELQQLGLALRRLSNYRDPRRFCTLLGRAPGATPRGCSLALEHLLEDG